MNPTHSRLLGLVPVGRAGEELVSKLMTAVPFDCCVCFQEV